MFDRIVRAIRLDPTLYRMVADDEEYTSEGVIIILIVAAISALGAALEALGGNGRPVVTFIVQLANTLVLGWLLWAVIAYFVGTALGGKSGIAEMARTLAYAKWRSGNRWSLTPPRRWSPRSSALASSSWGFGVFIVVRVIIGFVMGGLGVIGSVFLR